MQLCVESVIPAFYRIPKSCLDPSGKWRHLKIVSRWSEGVSAFEHTPFAFFFRFILFYRTDPFCHASVLELLKHQSFSRHLLVLMEEGSLFRIERMLDALGDDLYEMANYIESFANTQVWTPAKIERIKLRIAKIKLATSELCVTISSIAVGAEDILRKNNVRQSESVDAWEEGMLYVLGLTTSSRPSLTPGGAAPGACPDGIRTFLASSSAPWIAEIRLLATACKIAGIEPIKA